MYATEAISKTVTTPKTTVIYDTCEVYSGFGYNDGFGYASAEASPAACGRGLHDGGSRSGHGMDGPLVCHGNHNILNQRWEGTLLASPNMQQTRIKKIKNRNVECMVDTMGPHMSYPCCSWQTPSGHQFQHEQLWDQAQGNASDIQIEFKWFPGMGGRYLFATSTGEGHSCLVQECYSNINVYVFSFLANHALYQFNTLVCGKPMEPMIPAIQVQLPSILGSKSLHANAPCDRRINDPHVATE